MKPDIFFYIFDSIAICGDRLVYAIFKMGSGISVTSQKAEKSLFEGIWKKINVRRPDSNLRPLALKSDALTVRPQDNHEIRISKFV